MKQMLLRRLGAIGIATGFLLSAVLIGQTFAQSPQTEQPVTPEQRDSRPQDARGKRPKPDKKKAPKLKGILVDQTSALTGLSHKDVADRLRNNGSLTEIAKAHGSSEPAVIDAALKQLETHLTQAVANGRLTEERKAEALTKARAEAPALMNERGLKPGKDKNKDKNKPRHRDGLGALVEATAEVTGLTPDQIRAELETGKSLAQVAQARGKTADDILANLKVKADQRVNQLLEQAREQLHVVPKQK